MRLLVSSIVPETSKITTRGPLAASAARSDPVPASFRLVTRYTVPPLPAGVVEPNPSAPGNAGSTPPAGSGVTVMADVPLLPSLVAVIVATPAAAPVTRPVEVTAATAALSLTQLTTRPDSVFPTESFSV